MARRFHRTRHHAGRALSGSKGSLLSVGAGAGTGALANTAIASVPFLQSAWWAFPVALAAVGHFLKRKNPTIGGALLGVSGFLGYSSWVQHRGVPQAKGFLDAGFIDAGSLKLGTSYSDNSATSASPYLDSASANALLNSNDVMGLQDSAELEDAMGLQD